MEQLYLTRVNNLTAAWPSVYNRIDKHQVQVMKFQRKPQGGKLSSPALRVRALLVSVCRHVRITYCLFTVAWHVIRTRVFVCV